MKKRLFCLVLAVLCALALTACGCKHETWIDADCVTPKTCAECGEIEGAPLGHSWMAATCTTAKTCEICAATDGEPRGHAWQEATCDTAKTCSDCGETEGEALGHAWEDATTDAPKTCTVCTLTEGERIITDPRFTTAATKDLHGTWLCATTVDSEVMQDDRFKGSFQLNVILEFTNDGHLNSYFEAADLEAFKAVMTDYAIRVAFDSLYEEGYFEDNSEETMNAYMPFLEGYTESTLEETDWAAYYSYMNNELFYYVDGNLIYCGDVWASDMYTYDFTLDGDTLIMKSLGEEIGAKEKDLSFTRVTE